MYLIIWEDGSMWQKPVITDEDRDAADSGVCDIVTVSPDGFQFSRYDCGEFHNVLSSTAAR